MLYTVEVKTKIHAAEFRQILFFRLPSHFLFFSYFVCRNLYRKEVEIHYQKMSF